METVSDKEIRQAMEEEFGFKDYLSQEQEESVKAALRGDKNIIVSMATNSGKSLCFQLPRVLQRDGIVLVISPNLSLIENQMRYLNKIGLRAKSINSTTRPGSLERREIRESLMDPNTLIQFFFLTPEMVTKDFYTDFINEMLEDGLISYVVIDEAHCVADKNFRSTFKNLTEFRVQHPKIPFIALTTASAETVEQIGETLGMKNPTIIRSSSVKNNIFYAAALMNNDESFDFGKFFKDLVPDFKTLKPKEMPSGIIYCLTFQEVDQTLKSLEDIKVAATSFHSKIEHNKRFSNYDDWMADKIPVMVATTESFGLGIVKRHLKFVVHFGVPKNMRAYYQESGRAGVAGDKSISLICYKENDPRRNVEMYTYCLSESCRRRSLAKHFGDQVEDCGDRCDNCHLYNNLVAGSSPKKSRLI